MQTVAHQVHSFQLAKPQHLQCQLPSQTLTAQAELMALLTLPLQVVQKTIPIHGATEQLLRIYLLFLQAHIQ